MFLCNKVFSCTTLKAQTSCRVMGAFYSCVVAYLCLNTECALTLAPVCEHVHTKLCMCEYDWEGVLLFCFFKPWNRKFAERAFFFFFQKESLWSPACFFSLQAEEEKRRGFGGTGNKKAAGSCTFHSWLMSQWDDVSYQHSAHGGERRKVYWG